MDPPTETPTSFECEGQAGGAIVYNSVVILGQGGPGSVQLNPPIVNFPEDQSAKACCVEDPEDEDQVVNACKSDCARAACNQVLRELRDVIALDDPSDGACDALAGQLGTACRNRVRGSLEAWEASLVAQYDLCTDMAFANDDPDLAYDDFLEPFAPGRKIVLAGSGCSQDTAGCLFDGEVRLFCDVSGFQPLVEETCDMAGNPRDPEAPTESMLIGPGSASASVTTPGGDEIHRTLRSRGGALTRRCDEDGDCGFLLTQFGFEVDEELPVGPMTLSSISAEFFNAVPGQGSAEGDVEFAQSRAYLWVSTVVEVGHGSRKISVPWQFGIQADAPVLAVEADEQFSLTRFYALFGNGYRLELSTAPSACSPL